VPRDASRRAIKVDTAKEIYRSSRNVCALTNVVTTTTIPLIPLIPLTTVVVAAAVAVVVVVAAGW
jgi:hypothetical protein